MFCTKSGHNIENTYLLERIKGVRELRPIHRRGFAPGSFCMCQYTRGSVFKFAQFAQGACSQIFNLLNIVEHILRGGNSHEDEVYPWNRWYTRRSFALGACPWSMLREENPSCVSAFKTRRVRAPIDGVGKQPRPHVVYSGILISWEQTNVSYLLIVYFPIQWVIAFLPFQASTVITSLAAFLAVSKHLKIISTWK